VLERHFDQTSVSFTASEHRLWVGGSRQAIAWFRVEAYCLYRVEECASSPSAGPSATPWWAAIATSLGAQWAIWGLNILCEVPNLGATRKSRCSE